MSPKMADGEEPCVPLLKVAPQTSVYQTPALCHRVSCLPGLGSLEPHAPAPRLSSKGHTSREWPTCPRALHAQGTCTHTRDARGTSPPARLMSTRLPAPRNLGEGETKLFFVPTAENIQKMLTRNS